MQELISQLLAGLYYNLIASPRVVVKTETHLVKDPQGACKADYEFMKQHVRPPQWRPGTELEQVIYDQAQWDFLEFFRTQVIGRRTN